MIDFEKERSGHSYIHHQFCDYLGSQINIHNSYEFIHVYDGSFIVTINDKKYELKANDSLLILPGQIHSLQTKIYLPEAKPFLCIFSPDFVKDFSDTTANSELINPVFRLGDPSIIDTFVAGKDPFMRKSFLYLVCGLAAKAGLRKKQFDEDEGLIYKVVECISRNYMQELTLKQMASDLGYNYTYLSSFFNKNFTCGFSKFINEYRVTFAKNLLKETSLSMSQIATECGFFTIRNFNRAFLQFEKMPPKKFRQQLINNNLDSFPV